MDSGAWKQHLTRTGVIIGSLHYMSPEQINNVVNVDVRSDLYSVGIVLYEIVTGRQPFHGERDYSVLMAHLQQNPVPPIEFDPKIPTDLSNIILMSIAKNPIDRFQSADAFHAALEGLALPVMSTCVAAGNTALTSEPDATAIDTHDNCPTARNAQQPHWVANSGTTSGLLANGKARQRMWRSLFLGVKAILGLVVLALTIVGAQKLHHGGGHFRSEKELPAKVPSVTASVSVEPEIGQPEQVIPNGEPDADVKVGLPPQTASVGTATKVPQREVLSHRTQPADVLDRSSSESMHESKTFVPPPRFAVSLSFQAIDPPDIPSTESVAPANLNLELLGVASALPTAKAWHMHFLDRGAAGLLVAIGQRYRFQEERSSHAFEWSTDDFIADCKAAGAMCQIRITTTGHKQVIRLKRSDWLALEINVGHR